MDAEKFNFYVLRLLGKNIFESKNWISSFLPMASNRFLSWPLRQISHFPQTAFFLENLIFPQQKGGSIMELEKNDQN